MTTLTGARDRLRDAIDGCELPTYVYSYPSKRAYRPLPPAMKVADAWTGAADRINLYVHVPFCGYRCSFCTLFLTTSHTSDLVQHYVDNLLRQIRMYGDLLGHLEVVSLYVGGGTPTTLTPAQLESLFAGLHHAFPRWMDGAEVSVEGSPDTMTAETARCLKGLGVSRVSMGLQTLDEAELAKVGRPYSIDAVRSAVDAVGACNFDNVNLDLIYGLEAQDRRSWMASLTGTVDFAPDTLTLYPVVIRPLTTVSRRYARANGEFLADESKYALYDLSVAYLAERGYRQDSFVRFTTLASWGYRQEVADFSGVPLLGLGAGARSYTDTVHYGTEFAVGRRATTDIIEGFVAHDHRSDDPVGLGFALDDDERRRRYCVLTLSLGLLDRAAYLRRFGTDVLDDFGEQIGALVDEGCMEPAGAMPAPAGAMPAPAGATAPGAGGDHVTLTPKGFKFSNVIATLFRSERVGDLERTFVPS